MTALPLGWSGCAKSGGEGSETHFVNCKTDSDCVEANAGDRCVDRRCTVSPEGAGGTPPDGGNGGAPTTGGAGTGSAAATGGVGGGAGGAGTGGSSEPDSCDVPPPGTPLPENYTVSFRFENTSTAKLAILEDCFRHFEIFGCADGYAAPLPYSADYAGLPSGSCKRECPDTRCGCIGACQRKLTAVANTSPVEETWDGSLREPDTSGSGCGCVNTRAPSPGRYRVRVPVHPAEGDILGEPMYHVSVDFVLGTEANVTVVVPLDQGLPLPSCTGLDGDACEAAGFRCMVSMGRTSSNPTELQFAGCQNNLPVAILPGTKCSRSAPGEECWLFKDTVTPLGWEGLDCAALPADCGVPGNRHPAL